MLEPTRRDLIAGGMALGFAAAVRPVAASAVETPADGLDCGPFDLPTDDATVPAWQARPAGRTGLPVVLVVPEIFGLHAHITDVCRRLAHEGFHALSFDPFRRVGDVTRLTDLDRIRAVVMQVPDRRVLADLDALAAWAGAHGGDVGRLGVTGFCWGGRTTWLYAAHREGLDAAVAWYGRLRGPVTPEQPTWPVDVAHALKAPVLGLYGADDAGIPLADVEAMRSALAAAGRTDRLEVFPGVGHAFFADYRPSYDPATAARAWSLALAFLREHLRAA